MSQGFYISIGRLVWRLEVTFGKIVARDGPAQSPAYLEELDAIVYLLREHAALRQTIEHYADHGTPSKVCHKASVADLGCDAEQVAAARCDCGLNDKLAALGLPISDLA